MRHLGFLIRAKRALALALAFVIFDSQAATWGQALPSPSSLQSLMQNLQGSAPGLIPGTSGQTQGPPTPATPTTQTTLPVAPNPQPAPVSRLELLFSQRAGQPLSQFGYDTFGVGTPVTSIQLGAVQDSYILGAGDQLSITTRGHDNSTYAVQVDRDGRIIIPNLDPVMAAGRTFGEVRRDIDAVMSRAALNTRAYITLASARQISVIVSGEVNSPGVRTLSGLNSPVDAILLSGGVRKSGSLRNIIVERNGVRRHIDLYALLTRGNGSTFGALTEGDHVIVPSIGNTVAVIGMVKRPAIYELAPGNTQITASALLSLAGGVEIAGSSHLTKLALMRDGHTQLTPITSRGVVRSGEVLSLDQQQGSALGRVTLVGAVQVPGSRSLAEAPTVSRLIHDASELSPDAYTPFGIIIHRNARTNFRTVSAFSPKHVFEHSNDPALSGDDTVVIFSTSEVRILATAAANNMSIANANLSSGLQIMQQATTQAAQTAVPSTGTSQSQGSTASGQNTQTQGVPPPTGQGTVAQQIAAAQMAGQNPAQAGFAAQQGFAIAPPPPVQSSAQTGAPQTPTASSQASGTGPNGTTTPTVDPRVSAAMSLANPAAAALLQAQNQAGGQTFTGGLTSSTAFGSANASLTADAIAAGLGLTTPALENVVQDYIVWVQGQVLDPGPYLADAGTSLQAMLDAAGGVQRQADLSWVEVTSTEIDALSGSSHTTRSAYKGRDSDFQTVSLRPLDSIRVRQIYSDRSNGIVTIAGEVRYPGDFNITRGEKLSSVLARAGGITPDGYAYGSVFLRRSIAQAEEISFQKEASELESSVTVAAADPNARFAVSYFAGLAQEIRQQPALGRMTVVADPAMLAVKPDRDILVEPGDQLFIPKRPSTVAVAGEVLNASSFQYRPDLSVSDYIALAGGTAETADLGSTFIVYPDGSASPVDKSWLSFAGSRPIPPGSTIFVPRDPAPFNTTVFLTNVTDILSKLAITAASLAVLGRKN